MTTRAPAVLKIAHFPSLFIFSSTDLPFHVFTCCPFPFLFLLLCKSNIFPVHAFSTSNLFLLHGETLPLIPLRSCLLPLTRSIIGFDMPSARGLVFFVTKKWNKVEENDIWQLDIGNTEYKKGRHQACPSLYLGCTFSVTFPKTAFDPWSIIPNQLEPSFLFSKLETLSKLLHL